MTRFDFDVISDTPAKPLPQAETPAMTPPTREREVEEARGREAEEARGREVEEARERKANEARGRAA